MNRQQRRAAAKRGKTTAGGASVPVQTATMLDLALGRYRSGRFAEAGALCRRILSLAPDNAASLHLLGLIAYQQGHSDVAAERIRKAIALDDRTAEFHHNLGNILGETGRREEAAVCYRRALSLKPDSVDTLYNLGNVLLDLGQADQSIAYLQRAAILKPDSFEVHNNLGTAFHDLGRLDIAVASYERALALKPDAVETRANLASAFCDQGRQDQALAHYERALALRPDHLDSLNGLGIVLREEGRTDEAIAVFERALTLKPDHAETHNNLGNLLDYLHRTDEAVAHFEQALAVRPDYAETHNNLGQALEHQGRLDEAMTSYERALALKPEYAEARFNRSTLLLLRGDYERGWADYEWRWLCKEVVRNKRNFGRPKWSGEVVDGKTILIHAEQGFGDAIQFLRYVPMVAGRGGRVVLEVPHALLRVAHNLPGAFAAFAQGDTPPKFDLHCPLLSLPHLFATTLESIPGLVPYLAPSAEASAAWAERLSDYPGLKVGLVWSGNREHRRDLSRSITLQALEPLWDVEGVSWFSLQVGERADDVVLARSQPMEDLSHFLTDFAETEAAISHLDLIISVDTAVAHLAGALGSPVWVPLPYVPDWRWLLGRDDSPWYPTMRLFRQAAAGEWKGVIDNLADALARMVEERSANDA